MGRPFQDEVHMESDNGNSEDNSARLWRHEDSYQRYRVWRIPHPERVASKLRFNISCRIHIYRFYIPHFFFFFLNYRPSDENFNYISDIVRYSGLFL